MRHIEFNNDYLNELSIFLSQNNFYVEKIQNFLNTNSYNVTDSNSPEYIYHLLAEKTAKGLILISLPEMDELINKITNLPGWSWLRENNSDKEVCNNGNKCNIQTCNIINAHSIHKKLVDFFNDIYDTWKKQHSLFSPYKFIKSQNIKACPYCNLEYVQTATFLSQNTQDEKELKTPNVKDKYVRPALDHFYPKSKYPFFAISLNNLVPTCTTCNSSIKGDDDSIKSYKEILHPYDEEKINYSDCIKYIFTYIPRWAIVKFIAEYDEPLKEKEEELSKLLKMFPEKYHRLLMDKNSRLGISLEKFIVEYVKQWRNNVKQWKTQKKELEISLEDNEIILIDGMPRGNKDKEYDRASCMFNYFAIKPRLEQGHNDYIREIAIKAMEYPQEYIEKLQSKGYSVDESLRIFFGNYVKPEDFNQRPLSKITHDVIEQIRPDILKELEKAPPQETT